MKTKTLTYKVGFDFKLQMDAEVRADILNILQEDPNRNIFLVTLRIGKKTYTFEVDGLEFRLELDERRRSWVLVRNSDTPDYAFRPGIPYPSNRESVGGRGPEL